MPEIPDEAVHLVAERMLRRYESEYSAAHLTWRDFADDARADLEAAAPLLECSIRATIAASLRRAAAGRREYAGPHDDDSEAHPLLLKSAECYESAALIVEDPRSIMGVIPSWRWSAGESASIRSHPEVPRES